MIPYEIMLSESQERMLVICKPGMEKKFEEICEKWDLDYSRIGIVTEHKNLKVYFHDYVVADIPSYYLSAGDGAPVYKRETEFPSYLKALQEFDTSQVSLPADLNKCFLKVFVSPNIVSKKWVFEQYDYMVRTNTVIEPGSDAAVVRIKGSRKALAMKTDCNARYVYLAPRTGAAIAVAESARNVVCTGAKPVAITNCLNFGNPYKPQIFWQFSESIAGLGEACRILDTPVTGGNVSFYNESDVYQVYPTPVIGMIGIVEDVDDITPSTFQDEGDLVYVLGTTFAEIGGSEYLKVVHGKVAGLPPQINLLLEKRTQDAILAAIQKGLIKSAHDVSDGGLAVALAECCIADREKALGLKANLTSTLRSDMLCFSESQSRFIISASPGNKQMLEELFIKADIPVHIVGKVGGKEFQFNDWINIPLTELSSLYFNTLPDLMKG
jgi:phosphoribosylformylglycinamidine synthase II